MSIMTAYEYLCEQRETILSLADKHGAVDVRVFGSALSDQFREDSDIDFLVRTEDRTSPWFPAGLVLDLESLLNRKVDVVTEKSLHWYLRNKILDQAVPL